MLRYSHIFASTIRETLEVKPLREANHFSLTPSQANLLRLVSTNGNHPIGQVAHLLGVSGPAGTKTIDKLERLGLVARMRSPGDRRTTLLSISPAGREWVRRYDAQKVSRLAAALAALTPEEAAALARLLERFSVSMLQGAEAVGGACLRCAAHVEAGCPVGRVIGGCPYQEFRGAGLAKAATARAGTARGRT